MKNRFQEIVVSGTNREMGLQIGDACRETIKELASVVLHRFNLGQENNVSIKEAREISASALNFSRSYLNDEIQELIGISESSGVSLNDLMLLNCRNMFSVSQEGCTAILVSDERSDNGYSIAGQNWDNDPEMDKYPVRRRNHQHAGRQPDGGHPLAGAFQAVAAKPAKQLLRAVRHQHQTGGNTNQRIAQRGQTFKDGQAGGSCVLVAHDVSPKVALS